MKFSLNKEPMIIKRAIHNNGVTYTLPFMPPSTNNLYANVQGRGRVKTTKYRDWLEAAGLIIRGQGIKRMTERVDIIISLEDRHPQRDCDNAIKPLGDLLVASKILPDDNSKWVRSIKAEWAPIQGIRIEIRPYSFSHTVTA